MEHAEAALEPDLPIVDAHTHLWLAPETLIQALEQSSAYFARALAPLLRRQPRYLLDEYLADANGGHNIVASFYTDAWTMYRTSGPPELRSVGEVEFANGIGAMGESGLFGPAKICAAISGAVDLTMGDRVEAVLEAHLRAGGDRYRGVRSTILYDDDVHNEAHGGSPRMLERADFREGFKRLQAFDLFFEAMVFEPQLPELLAFLRDFPDARIVLNHMGGPVGIGKYAGKRDQRFAHWRDNIQELARHPNVCVKLGGMGMIFPGFPSFRSKVPFTSAQLAEEWKPYVLTCIEAFGVERAMFESNFPVDSNAGEFVTIWNAFKRIVAGASAGDKSALFGRTALRLYRVEDAVPADLLA